MDIELVYIIRRAWLNPWHTWGERPFGYALCGYVETKTDAEDMCRGCKVFEKSEYSFLPNDIPEYDWIAVAQFEGHRVRHFDTVEELEASYGR